MADLQSIEELLDSAERKQKNETRNKIADQLDATGLDHAADFVSLGNVRDANERSARGGRRGADRYSPGGSKREGSRTGESHGLSDDDDDHKSDRGSANGSVRSRRRSRSPRDRRDRSYRLRDERPRDGGDYYRRGNDGGDRYYRPGARDRMTDMRDDRRDRRDRRDDRSDRRDDRRREPRERRRTPPEPTDDERDRRTVFVQQLAARLRTYQLEDFFAQVGPVKEAQIVKDRVSNRSKGVGYVEFRNEESVEKALQLTGQKLLGIPIIAQLTEAEKNRQARNTEGVATLSNGIPFHRLYVGNIHFSITEDDLRTVFEPFGALEFCQLQKEEQGRSKGYGFVQFAMPDEAKEALEKMNGFELAGRPIRVGLGNDKFTPETTTALLQKFGPQGQAQAQQQRHQGSSFSGMGGRGSHAGGNANFDRAGGKDAEKTGGASALDDNDVAGVNFSNYSRDALMRKLARTDEPEPKVQPKAVQQRAPVDQAQPSRCVLLKHLYTEQDTNEPNWDKELEEDVGHECNDKYGKVVHIAVAPGSTDGEVYVKFDKLQSGENAIKGLNGRFFGGQRITAQFVVEAVYNMNFPQATNV